MQNALYFPQFPATFPLPKPKSAEQLQDTKHQHAAVALSSQSGPLAAWLTALISEWQLYLVATPVIHASLNLLSVHSSSG